MYLFKVSKLRMVSTWVVADLDTVQGRAIALSAVKHVKTSNQLRYFCVDFMIISYRTTSFVGTLKCLWLFFFGSVTSLHPVFSSVSLSVIISYIAKGREVTLPRPYRSTC